MSPRVKGSRLDTSTGKFIVPSSAPLSTGATTETTIPAVREPIRNMLASGSDEDFSKSLPESTATSGDLLQDRPTRKRRTRAEMEAESAPADPLMSDPIYKKACERLTSFGVPKIVNGVCTATGKPMSDEENEDVKALTYIAAKRSNIDPGKSWFALLLTALGVAINLVVARTNLGAMIKNLLAPPKPKTEPKKEQTV